MENTNHQPEIKSKTPMELPLYSSKCMLLFFVVEAINNNKSCAKYTRTRDLAMFIYWIVYIKSSIKNQRCFFFRCTRARTANADECISMIYDC